MEEPGFRIELDEEAGIVKLRGWGVWTVAMAEAYRTAMIRACERLRHRKWGILANRTGCYAQSEEVAEIVRDVMARASEAGRVRVALIADSATTVLQWRRLARGNPMDQRLFRDEASALEWLEAEAKSSRND